MRLSFSGLLLWQSQIPSTVKKKDIVMTVTMFAHSGLHHVEVSLDPQGNVTPRPGVKLKSGLYTLADHRTFMVDGDKIGQAITPLQQALANSALQIPAGVAVRGG